MLRHGSEQEPTFQTRTQPFSADKDNHWAKVQKPSVTRRVLKLAKIGAEFTSCGNWHGIGKEKNKLRSAAGG